MKRQSSIIALTVLAHLLVIDLSIYLLTGDMEINILAPLGYNIIWFSIAVIIGANSFKESRN